MRSIAVTRWLWLALIALQFIWFGWLYPSEHFGRTLPLMIFVVPLLMPAWWIWKLRPQAVVLGGTILLLHFSIGVAEAWANPEVRVIACVQLALIFWFYLAMPGIGSRKSAAPKSNDPETTERKPT